MPQVFSLSSASSGLTWLGSLSNTILFTTHTLLCTAYLFDSEIRASRLSNMATISSTEPGALLQLSLGSAVAWEENTGVYAPLCVLSMWRRFLEVISSRRGLIWHLQTLIISAKFDSIGWHCNLLVSILLLHLHEFHSFSPFWVPKVSEEITV